MVNAYYCFARRVNKFGNFAITYGDEVKSLITLPPSTVHGVVFRCLVGRPPERRNDKAPEPSLRGVASGRWRDQLCDRRAMKMS